MHRTAIVEERAMKKLHLLPVAMCLTFLAAPVWPTTGTLTVRTNTTLTEDHVGNIVIAGNFITLDCANFTVLGNGTGIGIQLNGIIGVTVTNCSVSNFEDGFALTGSGFNTFSGNRATNNQEEGFDLEASSFNTFVSNQANQNGQDGFDLDDSNGNLFEENVANENGRNGFELDRCVANTFAGNIANGNGRRDDRSGFSLDQSTGNFFIANVATENSRNGFRLGQSSGNIFSRNVANGNIQNDCELIGLSTLNKFLNDRFNRAGGCVFFGAPD
jgi:parallel beta-helix repeat protein